MCYAGPDPSGQYWAIIRLRKRAANIYLIYCIWTLLQDHTCILIFHVLDWYGSVFWSCYIPRGLLPGESNCFTENSGTFEFITVNAGWLNCYLIPFRKFYSKPKGGHHIAYILDDNGRAEIFERSVGNNWPQSEKILSEMGTNTFNSNILWSHKKNWFWFQWFFFI